MSQGAYADAVKQTIQTLFNVDDASCDVMFDGQPKPSAGQWFYAVHPGSWTAQGEDYDLDEKIDIQVTVTRRLGDTPQDLGGIAVWKKYLEPRCRQIVGAIHFNYDVMNLANSLITAGSDEFHKPVIFTGAAGTPQLKGPDWFTAITPDAGTTADAGVCLTLRFSGAERTQGVQDEIA